MRRTNRLSDTDGELWAQPSVDDFGLDLFGVGEAATSGLGLAGGCTYIPPHRRRRPRTCTQPDTLRVRGGDNGIDRNKKRLSFTYNFMFSRSHDLPRMCLSRTGGQVGAARARLAARPAPGHGRCGLLLCLALL